MVLLPIAAKVVYRTWPALRNCWPSRVHACQQKVTLSCAIVRSSESPGARRDGRSRRRAPVARSRATYAADWSRHPRRSPDRMLHRRNGASFVRQIVAPSTRREAVWQRHNDGFVRPRNRVNEPAAVMQKNRQSVRKGLYPIILSGIARTSSRTYATDHAILFSPAERYTPWRHRKPQPQDTNVEGTVWPTLTK